MYTKNTYARKRIQSFWGLGIIVVTLLLISVIALPAHSYVYKDAKRGTTLSLYGIGQVRLNYASVSGNAQAFEDSTDGFAEGFDTKQFLSLVVNGTVYREYTLDGYINYQETKFSDDTNLPEWQFRFKLSREANYLILGDQEEIFSEAYFTKYSNLFRGLTLHFESSRFGVTSFGALTQGTFHTDELKPNGTSGPYYLRTSPVVFDSEQITLEVRNRNDPQVVLEDFPQYPGIDYEIDYQKGKITFTRPIDPETFEGNPVVIVVTYLSEADSSAFSTALMGTRVTITPASWGTVGLTYISRFPKDPSLSDGFEIRQEIYGIDGQFTLFDGRINVTPEYAAGRDLAASVDNNDDFRQAFQVTMDGIVGDKFEMEGTFHRTEEDFPTFANPDLAPNEQELDWFGIYTYRPDHTLEAGYLFWQDNVSGEAEEPTTTTHHPYIDWEAQIREHTKLFSGLEYIRTSDDQSPKNTDENTKSASVGATQKLLNVPYANTLTLTGEYRFDAFEDQTDTSPDTNTHQIGLLLEAEPQEEMLLSLEQRERWIRDTTAGENTRRHDITQLGVTLNHWERLGVQTDYTYHVIHDLLNDQRASTTHTITLQTEYQLLPQLTGTGKFEFRKETRVPSDASSAATEDWVSQSLNAEARLLWVVKKNLNARLRYTYDLTEEETSASTKRFSDQTELQVNYTFANQKSQLNSVVTLERDLSETSFAEKTDTQTLALLLSGLHQLTDHWETLAHYKYEIDKGDRESVRQSILAEAGYRLGKFLKLSSGYQFSDVEDDLDAAQEYTAHSVYLKLTGKL